MEDLVLWKPLYYTSIALFILSLVLFPFNSQWSIVTILLLLSLWTRIPGFIHFIFNKLAMNDMFTLIIAANMGGLAGGIFGAFTMVFSRLFGPNEWMPYTIRATVALFVGGLSVPLIIASTGGVNTLALYLFEGVVYAVFYIQVLLFWREEIGIEIGLLPIVIFFDFFLTGWLVGAFGQTLSDMLTKGLTSGWPFIIFSGIILFYIWFSVNGKKIEGFLESIWNRIGGKKIHKKDKEFFDELEN
ncbi:MAG: hypothetical protein HYW22_02055 [Candidatus Aenigmarchaeota archaeon]|nr:hypothetical protein [Candidatus Aenigmarchaeota archaeon]